MLTETRLRQMYLHGEKLVVAIVGDSFTYGVTSNPGSILHTNGLPYGFNNPGILTPNNDPGSPYYLDQIGYLSQSKQNDVTMPTYPRLVWDALLQRNANSVVHNMGVSGAIPDTHLVPIVGQLGTTPQNIAALPEKPDVVFIMLGPNSAKNKTSQLDKLQELTIEIQRLDIFVVLVHASNIGTVPNTESGITPGFSTEPPENWVPMRAGKNANNELDTVSLRQRTGWLSCGTYAMRLDITKMYDPFHPNPAGLIDIKNNFIGWFINGSTRDYGAPVILRDGTRYRQTNTGNGALRQKLPNGKFIRVPLQRELNATRLNSGTTTTSFAK